MRKFKYVIIVLSIFVILMDNICLVNADSGTLENLNILIVCSYSSTNQWEQSVVDGIRDRLSDSNFIHVEFLDSTQIDTAEYKDRFLSLLNIKYSNQGIDYVITIDDEAYSLMSECILDSSSIVYKKQLIFAGINMPKRELVDGIKDYVHGIGNKQKSGYDMIKLISNVDKDVEDIYFLLDRSIYCLSILENIEDMSKRLGNDINIHYLIDDNLDSIQRQCRLIESKKSAICLCGTYTSRDDSKNSPSVASESTINLLKSTTKTPIYSTLIQYIDAGAIGGIVNDGYNLGGLIVQLMSKIDNGETHFNIVPLDNTFNTLYFNFKAVREYGVNPLCIPMGAKYINKGPYDLLMPRYIIDMGIIICFFVLILIIFLIQRYISNKKMAIKKDLLIAESLEREKVKTDFILTISHELRTPLNVIQNSIKLLKIRINDNDFNKDLLNERLDVIQRNSKRLNRYINNVIDMSRLEVGQMNLHLVNENIVEIVENTTMSVVDLASSYNIDVVFDTTEEEIFSATDKIKLERILLNLLSNAIKFTRDSGSIMVIVTKNNGDNSYSIEVSDTGIGISEEVLSHIFDKFKKDVDGDSLSRNYEGSGLGLYIVKGLCNLLGGTIFIDSEKDIGTKIILTFPIQNVEEDNHLVNHYYEQSETTFSIEMSDIEENGRK